jgi:molecular chaperone GrpE
MSTPKNDNEPKMPDEPADMTVNDDVASADIAREAAQIAALHEEIAELKERYLRASAETENVRKRAEREKNDATQFAFQKFARDLLSVVDNFSRAFDAMKPEVREAMPPEAQSVFAGIEATQRELTSILERNGVKRIEAKGQRFNPNLHQAIAEVPSRDHPAGTVIEVVQQGYVIGERLLRAAMVAVATQPPATNGAAKNGSDEPGSHIDTSA